MVSKERSPIVSQYVWLMRILGVIYAFGGALFFFFPHEVFYLVNVGPRILAGLGVGASLLPIPEPSEQFWLVLASSMMAMLSALSFLASESPRVRGYTLVHLLSKIVSSAGFLYVFLHGTRYFAYLVGIAADFPIAVVVSLAYLRMAGQR